MMLKKLSKKKILKLKLNVCAIFFLSSCGNTNFNWKPDPYSGDSINKQVISSEGVTVKCDQPAFDEMFCFDSVNLAELKTAIQEVEGQDKYTRRKVRRAFRKIGL